MSELDEKDIRKKNIIRTHAFRIHIMSKNVISYEIAQSLVRGIIQEYDLANDFKTSENSLNISSVVDQLPQICYKTNEPCKHNCQGLCKESC